MPSLQRLQNTTSLMHLLSLVYDVTLAHDLAKNQWHSLYNTLNQLMLAR